MEDRNGFTKADFNKMEGYFLNEKIVNTFSITNFECTISGMRENKNLNTAFIALRKDGSKVELEMSKEFEYFDNFVIENPLFMTVYVTEQPLIEMIDIVPQFIVPDAVDFMREVHLYFRDQNDIQIITLTDPSKRKIMRTMIEHLLHKKYHLRSVYKKCQSSLSCMENLILDKYKLNPDVFNFQRDYPQMKAIIQSVALLESIDMEKANIIKKLSDSANLKSNDLVEDIERDAVIINYDISLEARNTILDAVKKKANRILFYSVTDKAADLHLVSLKELKDITEVTVSCFGCFYTYYLNYSNVEIIESSLAVVLALETLNIESSSYLPLFLTLPSIPKVMEIKRGYIDGKKVDIVDDMYNSTIQSMINAITSFTDKVKYYGGKKILALGQIADLGKFSEELHEKLLPYINQSGADILLGYGEGMRKVVHSAEIPALWFETMEEYFKAVREQITENSLVLLKGSVSASDYNRISALIDEILTKKRSN